MHMSSGSCKGYKSDIHLLGDVRDTDLMHISSGSCKG